MLGLTAVCLLGKSGFCLLSLEQSLIFKEFGFFLKKMLQYYLRLLFYWEKDPTCNETLDIFILIFNAYSNYILVSW